MIQKLEEFRADWEGRRLIYGLSDCAIMVSDWVFRVTGENPMQEWPKYNSLKTARSTLKKIDFLSAVTSKLIPLENHFYAMEGDIIAIKSQFKNMPALGIYLAPHAVLAFGAITDIEGNIIPCSEQVRRLGMEFCIGNAWRPKCQPL